MLKRRVKVFTTAVLTIILVFALALGVSGDTGTKQLSALFRNIKIIANGKVVQAETEPFIINGRTYVPLRVISEALGAWVDWNQATSMITIKGGSPAEVQQLKDQLAAKDLEIAQLKAQLEGNVDLGELEDELIDDYDYLEDVEINDIGLTGDEDDVTVAIEVDLDDYGTEWGDLTDTDIEGWLDDLCADIQDYLSDDTNVDGEIVDIDSDDTLVDFSKDGDDDLDVDFEDDDYRNGGASESDIDDVEDALSGDTFSVEGIDFELYNVNYDTRYDEIDVTLYGLDYGTQEDWNDLTSTEIEDGIEYICLDIVDSFIDDANADPELVNIDVRDEDGVLLDSFEYDVDTGSLD